MQFHRMKIKLFVFISVIFSFTHAQESNQNIPQQAPSNEQNITASKNNLKFDINNLTSYEDLILQGELNGYFSIEQAEEIVQSLREQASELFLPLEVIGHSFEGREIRMHCITNITGNNTLKEEADKKTMGLMTALHHPREPMTLSLILYVMSKVVYEYKRDVIEYQNLLTDNILCFLPVFNVDGYQDIFDIYRQSGEIAEIRKNRNNQSPCHKSDHMGVDLNRNYDYGWDIDPEGSSTNPCQEDFRGTKPFSEPETRAMRDFVGSYNSSLKTAINLHAYGNLWITPYNCYRDETVHKSERFKSIYADYKNSGVFPEDAVIGNAIETVGYVATGEASDWMLGTYGIIAISPELGIHGPEAYKFFPEEGVIHQVIQRDFPAAFYLFSKLNPTIEIQNSQEEVLEEKGNHKMIPINLSNKSYRDLLSPQLQMSIRVLEIDENSLLKASAPEIYITESNNNDPSYYKSKFFTANQQPNLNQSFTNTTIFTISSDFEFKSWAELQIRIVLPFSSYKGGYVSFQITENGKVMSNSTKGNTYNFDFEGFDVDQHLVQVKESAEIKLLIISISVVLITTFLIIYGTLYYFKVKKQREGMFTNKQPPGLEFVPVEDDESMESGRI